MADQWAKPEPQVRPEGQKASSACRPWAEVKNMEAEGRAGKQVEDSDQETFIFWWNETDGRPSFANLRAIMVAMPCWSSPTMSRGTTAATSSRRACHSTHSRQWLTRSCVNTEISNDGDREWRQSAETAPQCRGQRSTQRGAIFLDPREARGDDACERLMQRRWMTSHSC